MARKMLIEATHPEESRVAVIDGSILDDYDAESSTKKQFKGNIYLAKVIRIEPSLQAAFVEYGHNRHGFLPFAEIHPDYYRIPVGDRAPDHPESALPNEEANLKEGDESGEILVPEELTIETSQEEIASPELESSSHEALPSLDTHPESVEAPLVVDEHIDLGEDEESVVRSHRPYRYKIQEVIKRRQILLVQVVKEERGNKGAALTTYLSLPGRYCVLMPNAGHRSGGISRKISEPNDRKRLREILKELPIPNGVSLIVRTAGQDRNKQEIRRDFEYLIRLWSDIREKTLTSIAPAIVYAEGDLIKRSIRDNYGKEIEEIIVEGEEGYKAAKSFMKTLVPSHAKRVKLYKERLPLFQHYNIETQVDAIMSPVSPLPSGGSIVMNTTEALVAIDVNSGKSTRERHIDETALKTNLEAADEIARQMRLRDLAGLIVIDFIDMADQKHIASVEKRFRDAVRNDRARIQIGKISQFGLLELSRQRLRPSLIEENMRTCTHCHGTGLVRSVESTSLFILRAIEAIGLGGRSAEIVVTVPSGVDLYLLNQKRSHLIQIEKRYEMAVQIQRDDILVPPEYRIDILVDRASLTRSAPIKAGPADEEKNRYVAQTPESKKSSPKPQPQDKSEDIETASAALPTPSDTQPGEQGRQQNRQNQQRHRRHPYQNRRRFRNNDQRPNHNPQDQSFGDKDKQPQSSSQPLLTNDEFNGNNKQPSSSKVVEILSKEPWESEIINKVIEQSLEVSTKFISDNESSKAKRNKHQHARSRKKGSDANKAQKKTENEANNATPDKNEPEKKSGPQKTKKTQKPPKVTPFESNAAAMSFNSDEQDGNTLHESKSETPKKKRRGFWSRLLDTE